LGRRIAGSAALLVAVVTVSPLPAALASHPAGADTVSSLTAQAREISQQLVQEQLQVGAYQQQYSVASQKVTDDSRAITETEQQIGTDTRQVRAKRRQVRQLAVASYVYGGGQSSASNASLFSDHDATALAAGEYTTIVVGNLTKAEDQLHTAEHTLQSHQAALQQQQSQDREAQDQQAADLAQANSTAASLQAEQAKVTGQLATAVAQQASAQAAAATAAVAAAQRAAVPVSASSEPTSSASPPSVTPSPVGGATTDPALNPFLQCVVQAESGGNYGAVSPNGLYMGAFQFSQATWNYAAQAAGLPGLVGVPPNLASKADQDTVAVALYALDGEQPWLGDRCSN
jgi:peptidoglycan hydrolase CwlO-like protein